MDTVISIEITTYFEGAHLMGPQINSDFCFNTITPLIFTTLSLAKSIISVNFSVTFTKVHQGEIKILEVLTGPKAYELIVFNYRNRIQAIEQVHDAMALDNWLRSKFHPTKRACYKSLSEMTTWLESGQEVVLLKTFGYLPRISNWLDLVYNAKWQIDTPPT